MTKTPRLVPLLVLVWIGACAEKPPPAPLPPTLAELEQEGAVEIEAGSEPAPHVVVAFVLGDRGQLDPCACPEGVVGGHSRRTSVLRALTRELGTLPFMVGPGSLTTSEERAVGVEPLETAVALREIYAISGAGVIALGARDVAHLSPAELSQLADLQGVPLLATNLEGQPGEGLRKVVTLQTSAGSVAVLSLVDPQSGPLAAAGYEVLEPGAAAAAALTGVVADAVVAFCDASPRRLPEIARTLSGVDFLIGEAAKGDRSGLESHRGARVIFHEPGSLRVALLDLVFTGPRLAGFGEAADLRGAAEQRLLTVERRVRASLLNGSADSGDGLPADEQRLEALDKQLTIGSSEQHVFGFQALPVLLEYPEAEDASQAIRQLGRR